MAEPRFPLPLQQRWDCQSTGTCCKEYRILLSDEERQRIERQGWDVARDLDGLQPAERIGWWRPRYALRRRADGACVFLNADGRCKIHERHGYDAKPLGCRLFPFLLIPVDREWRVGLRFACPAAAASQGRVVQEHGPGLAALADQLAEREHLDPEAAGALTRAPRFSPAQQIEWHDLIGLADRILERLRDRRMPFERRWRVVLAALALLRQTRLDQLAAAERPAVVQRLFASAETQTLADPRHVAVPTALGRVLFRLAAALYTRKDHGPNRGLASQGRLALFAAVVRFVINKGSVPTMHRLLASAQFEQAEQSGTPLSAEAESVLERYYTIKVESFQFCGPHAFGQSFLDGLEALALTLPLNLWLIRLFRPLPDEEAAVRAIQIVDDHFGFNPLLASWRMRLACRTLAHRSDVGRLIAWYSR